MTMEKLFRTIRIARAINTRTSMALANICIALVVQKAMAQPRGEGADIKMRWEVEGDDESPGDKLAIKREGQGRRPQYVRVRARALSADAERTLRRKHRSYPMDNTADIPRRRQHVSKGEEFGLWKDFVSTANQQETFGAVRFMLSDELSGSLERELEARFPKPVKVQAPKAATVQSYQPIRASQLRGLRVVSMRTST